jgi:hypothetical protein
MKVTLATKYCDPGFQTDGMYNAVCVLNAEDVEEAKATILDNHPKAVFETIDLVRPDWEEKTTTVYSMKMTRSGNVEYTPHLVMLKPVYCNRCAGTGYHGPMRRFDGLCYKCMGAGFVIKEFLS